MNDPNYHKSRETTEVRLLPRLSGVLESMPRLNASLKTNVDFLLDNAPDRGSKSLLQLTGPESVRHDYFDAALAAAKFIEATRQCPPEAQAVLVRTYREILDIIVRAFYQYQQNSPKADFDLNRLGMELESLVKNANGSKAIKAEGEVGMDSPRSSGRGNADDKYQPTVMQVQSVIVGELRPVSERTSQNQPAIEKSTAQSLALFERINEIVKNSMPPENLKSAAGYRDLRSAFEAQMGVLKALRHCAELVTRYVTSTAVKPIIGERPDQQQSRITQQQNKRKIEQINIAKNSAGLIAQTIQAANRLYGVRVLPEPDKFSDNNL